MAPGGGASCKEIIETWQNFISCDTTNTQLEKSITYLGEKFRKSSIHSVHELLECPICTRSMYPPVYQVNTPLYVIVHICYQILYIYSFLCNGCDWTNLLAPRLF